MNIHNGSRPELAAKIDSCIEELIQDGDAGMDDHIAKAYRHRQSEADPFEVYMITSFLSPI